MARLRLDRIDERLKALGLKAEGASKSAGLARDFIRTLKRRPHTNPRTDTLARLAVVLQCDVRYLIDEIDTPVEEGATLRRSGIVSVPIISWVSAGRLIETGCQIEMKDAPTLALDDLEPGSYFATTVVGDSMDRVSPEGSRVIVNTDERDPLPGRRYIFSHRGKTTYKRFENHPIVRLEPESTNPAHDTIYPDDTDDWTVIGRVRRTILDL